VGLKFPWRKPQEFESPRAQFFERGIGAVAAHQLCMLRVRISIILFSTSTFMDDAEKQGNWCSGSTSTSHVEGQDFDYPILQFGVLALLAQLAAHRSDKAAVNGSIPLESNLLSSCCNSVG
jgi:hypothetical protein